MEPVGWSGPKLGVCEGDPDPKWESVGLITSRKGDNNKKSTITTLRKQNSYMVLTNDYLVVTIDYLAVTIDYLVLTSDYLVVTIGCLVVTSDYLVVTIDCLVVTSDYLVLLNLGQPR